MPIPMKTHDYKAPEEEIKFLTGHAHIINELVAMVHGDNVNRGWWHDKATGKPIERNFGELLALIHSEISEALEGDRKDQQDDKLPHRKMAEVELADAMIRIFDLAGGCGFDLGGAMVEKLRYNQDRADHKRANRAAEGGKAY